MNAEHKMETIESILKEIRKNHGMSAIMQLGDYPTEISCVSTGSLSLDLALGKGIPQGRVTEIKGTESAGKTTLALTIIASAQKDGIAAFIDAEHALDMNWAKTVGVDVDNLLISQPDSGEQALEIAEDLIRSNSVKVVVIDSVSALVPHAELEGSMSDASVGGQSRLMSKAMRKLTAIISKSQVVLIFINQIRMKIGVMFGNPETTSGGQALKFYSSVRIDMRRISRLKVGSVVVGDRIRAKVIKNKVAPPFRTAEFDLMFDSGISQEGELLDLGVEKEIIIKTGAWYNYGQVRLGQGRENSKQFLIDNPKLKEEIKVKLYKESVL